MKGTALRIIVKGRVQGVSFRYFTKRSAQRLGVVGWVRNLKDGTVEVQAAGSVDELDRFREALRQGPSSARVDGLEEEPIAPVPDWKQFDIVY